MATQSQPVIYEVNLTVDVEVIERFDEWLHKHNEEMLAVPGFISVATSVPDVEDEFKKHRCVQYRLSDQSAFDEYLKSNADEMRAKIVQHFDGHFTATRRVLSVAEAALAIQGVCSNCDSELTGRFCNACGQREEPRVPTMGALAGEFTNELIGVESKLWRSFAKLLFRPGHLTSVYLAGRRQKYMSPVRLYLLFSIATFAAVTLLNDFDGINFEPQSAPAETELVETVSDTNESDQAELADEVRELESQEEGGETEPVISQIDEISINTGFLSEEVNQQVEERIKHSAKSIYKDIKAGNQKAVFDKFFEPLPTALFLFLPIIAFFFKILFLGSGKYYVEHLIFVLHNHAFMFALILFTIIVGKSRGALPQYDIVFALLLGAGMVAANLASLRNYVTQKFSDSTFKACLIVSFWGALFAFLVGQMLQDGTDVVVDFLWYVYVPYYVYRSMRVVYQRSGFATALSVGIMSLMYLILLIVMLFSSAVFVGFTYD